MLQTVAPYNGREGQYWVPNPNYCTMKLLFWKLFGIGHMYIYIFLLRMADTMTSQNIDLSFGDTL
jgi:hypothetical protein